MHNSTIHMLRAARQKRVYPGENSSYLLIGWLNQAQERKLPTRLHSLIEILKNPIKSIGQTEFPGVSINPRKPGLIGNKTQFANSRRVSNLLQKIKSMLSGYSTSPHFSISTRSLWRVSWTHTPNKYKLNIGILAGGNYDEIVFGEGDAIASVLRLLESGYLARLRRCNCGHWFYARFTRQTFCAMPCQQRHFRKTDEYRADRRKYMRKHRKILAEREKRQFAPRLRNKLT